MTQRRLKATNRLTKGSFIVDELSGLFPPVVGRGTGREELAFQGQFLHGGL